DPETHRFHVIDQAIVAAKIGDVLGPEFGSYATALLDRTLPMDLEHIAAARPELASQPGIPELVAQRPRGFHDPVSGTIVISPRYGDQPRSLSDIAAVLVHEGTHALQPDARLIRDMLDSVPPTQRGELARR